MGDSGYLFARPSFISGVARLFDLAGTLNTYNISPSGEIADARAFYEDWKVVGDDMRASLEEYRKNQELKING